MTRYTRDEAVNALASDQRVYLYEDANGRQGYRNSTLEFLVQDRALAGTWMFENAHKLATVYLHSEFLFEPVPATIEVGVDGMALARAILSVPAGYDWLLRSHERGYYFAHVMSPDFLVIVRGLSGEDAAIGHSFKAIADTPQAALAGAVRQALA